jgi:Xaa-Pro aminopeptidase
VDRSRIERLQAALREARLDALVLRLPENLVMALGSWPMNGLSYGLFTAEAGPVGLVAPSCEDEEMDGCWAGEVQYFVWPKLAGDDPRTAIGRAIGGWAKQFKLSRARIGYEGDFECVAPAHNAGEVIVPCEGSWAWLKSLLPRAVWQDATALVNQQRAVKTDREIERLRIAHRVAALGLKRFMDSTAPGVAEVELAAAVYTECLVRGSRLRDVRHVNVYPQVSCGPNAHRAWRPIVSTGRRRLRSGELALLELAVCVDGFWADVTRVQAAGRPSALQRDVFAAVERAQEAALRAIRAGVEALVPHEAATGVLVEAGFQKYLVHLTGHGVGFRYHEPEPMLMPGNVRPLCAGNVCTVEPGLYGREFGGIRLEDNVVVTAEGVENLTKTGKTL